MTRSIVSLCCALAAAGGWAFAPGAWAQAAFDGYQYWHQGSSVFETPPGHFNALGRAVASGDFNFDGFADLAIGEPEADDGAANGAGVVHVLYGGPDGPMAPAQLWTATGIWGLGFPKSWDRFGSALAAADFNDDSFADLAIGAPGRGVNEASSCGAVTVLYGSPGSGLRRGNAQLFHQDVQGFLGFAESLDRLGAALAAGNFDGDGFVDLAIGIPGEDDREGAVAVLYGGFDGLSTARMGLLSQDSRSQINVLVTMPGTGEIWEDFGAALAAGNFDGLSPHDLAIGVPMDDNGVGGIEIVRGYDGLGLDPFDAELWNPIDLPGFDQTAWGSEYGRALAAGDFNRDGRVDLAVGVPSYPVTGTDSSTHIGAGAVHILPGADRGLSWTGQVLWTQESPGMPGEAEDNDHFGSSLAGADFDGDGIKDDLAVGAPEDSADTVEKAGTVTALFGSDSGLATAGAQLFSQAARALELRGASADPRDEFGGALTVGDFNRDGRDDLAMGSPSDLVDGAVSGSVAVCLVVGEDDGGVLSP